jgi:uncharacterized membrane protein
MTSRFGIRIRQLTALSAAASLATLVVTGPPSARAAGQTASSGEQTARKGRSESGIRARGFVRDNGGFLTIDAPRATTFTVVMGNDNRGRTAGAYVDRRGKLRGFKIEKGEFTTIDVPGAAATFASQINDAGQIVGAYSSEPDTPLLQAEHGFLLDENGFTTIDVPGAVQTRVFGINNAGLIVGEYLDSADTYHGFLLDNGTFTTIDAPAPATDTTLTGINDSGRIVGTAYTGVGTGIAHGFVWDSGTFTTIDVPGFAQTRPWGIDNRGRIAGYANDLDGATHGFVFENGTFTAVDAPDAQLTTRVFDINDAGQLVGAYDLVSHGYLQEGNGRFTTIDVPGPVLETTPFGINNRGAIVGSFVDARETVHGFLRDRKGDYTTLDFPGALSSGANGINDAGQIVGFYSVTSRGRPTEFNAFLLENGVFTNIDPPGAGRAQAFHINNRGQIVGEYHDASGSIHGFLRDGDGAYATIDIPGALFTTALFVSDRGQILGLYADPAGAPLGFVRDEQGAFTAFELRPVSIPTAPRLPRNITFASSSFDAKGLHHGFLLARGRFAPLSGPTTAFGESAPTSINSRGQVVGSYE